MILTDRHTIRTKTKVKINWYIFFKRDKQERLKMVDPIAEHILRRL